MPPVRTETSTLLAFGVLLAPESAGGWSTIVPVDEPAAFATVYSISTGAVGSCIAVR